MKDKYMTSKEAAEYLGFAHRTFESARYRNELSGKPPPKHYKVGRTIRYRKEDLDSWIQSTEEEKA